MTEAKNLSDKPEDELEMETVIEEIKNYIKRIRSMAKEVIDCKTDSALESDQKR